MSISVYIIDDESITRDGLELILEEYYSVRGFSSAEEALAVMETNPPDLILLDIGLPGMNGVQALDHINRRYPDTMVIMISAYEEVKNPLVSGQVYAYVVKPVEMEALLLTLRNASRALRMRDEIRAYQRSQIKARVPWIMGNDGARWNTMEVLHRIAGHLDISLLIIGETKTNTDLIAKTIHYLGANFMGPMVTFTCRPTPGLDPKGYLETVLFGNVKNGSAETGSKPKKSVMKEAAGGTLHLCGIETLGETARQMMTMFHRKGVFFEDGENGPQRLKPRVVCSARKELIGHLKTDDVSWIHYEQFSVFRIPETETGGILSAS